MAADGQLVGSLNTTVAGLPAVAYVTTRTMIYRVQAFPGGQSSRHHVGCRFPQEVASGVTDELVASVELTP